MITPYHAKYYAHELTARKLAHSIDRLTYSLVEASVDLNPHQIEAALFALRSPLSKGVILADEVGLGKTIEAGLLLCQHWAEHRRRLLIICPAALRRQWSIELEEKFRMPSLILDNKIYQKTAKDGLSPFMFEGALIMSYHLAARLKDELQHMAWDLCVIDEAHKLRNVFKKDNKMGKAICEALQDKRKVLLTATPLQNSLMELYGLGMLIDDRIFGSEEAFRINYVNGKPNLTELQERLKPFIHRTLRRDVLEYIRYTNREAITIPFIPSEKEEALYNLLSDFILRQDTYSIPSAQRKLVVLVIRKLLSSSTYAIIGTLKTIRQRLLDLQSGEHVKGNIAGFLAHENDLSSEYDEASEDIPGPPRIPEQKVDADKLKAELAEIDHYIEIARSITVETKAVKLLHALEVGFERMKELGAQEKVIIFTESNRTQHYLTEYLEQQPGYKGQIATFNGQNNDDLARDIYNRWKDEHDGSDRITGSRDVDMRQALVDHFRNHAKVMIATEAAAEGMNLQFCSMLVNYDLPWNPQRVEQRIGRCHRYGQKHDVVVINFLNEKNWADQRIYELLRYKFQLFDGVFGASDEVLGRIEEGIDFEKRISDIFDTCRTPEAIEAAFNNLREELEEPITERVTQARKMLFENFDEDVHQRMKLHKEQAEERKNEMLDFFWLLTKYVLIEKFSDQFVGDYHFDDQRRMFGTLKDEIEHSGAKLHERKINCSFAYRLVSFDTEDHRDHWSLMSKAERQRIKLQPKVYKPSSDLGKKVIETAKVLDTPPAHLVFDYSSYPHKITALENLRGSRGWLRVAELRTRSFEENTHLVLAAVDESGNLIPNDVARKLFKLQAKVKGAYHLPENESHLTSMVDDAFNEFMRSMDQNNSDFFSEEMAKLDKWAEDQRTGLKSGLKEMDEEIKELKKHIRQTGNLPDKLALQKKVRKLEASRDEAWRQYDDSAKVIEAKKDELIDMVETRLKQQTSRHDLFNVSFEIQ
ncbi:SNF2-related protein [Pseudochelatococcus sp. G4_1912]|uniref:SNF2-related protein n=1 Tax=Pseudochelatococcus sp. G4_1912 TaxID=3114288 RepID=UPI0039C65DC6